MKGCTVDTLKCAVLVVSLGGWGECGMTWFVLDHTVWLRLLMASCLIILDIWIYGIVSYSFVVVYRVTIGVFLVLDS